MIASLLVSPEVLAKQIRKEEYFKYKEHDKKFYQDDSPQIFTCPADARSPESLIIEHENPFHCCPSKTI